MEFFTVCIFFRNILSNFVTGYFKLGIILKISTNVQKKKSFFACL